MRTYQFAFIIAVALGLSLCGQADARDRFDRHDDHEFMETHGERPLTYREREYRRDRDAARQERSRSGEVPRYRDTPAREPVYKRYERRFERKE